MTNCSIHGNEVQDVKPFHWGILAPGTIAHKFVQGLSVLEGAVPYAVGSRDLGRAKAFAAQYGIKKAHGSYEELARDPEVDAIYVAPPTPSTSRRCSPAWRRASTSCAKSPSPSTRCRPGG